MINFPVILISFFAVFISVAQTVQARPHTPQLPCHLTREVLPNLPLMEGLDIIGTNDVGVGTEVERVIQAEAGPALFENDIRDYYDDVMLQRGWDIVDEARRIYEYNGQRVQIRLFKPTGSLVVEFRVIDSY